MVSLYQSGRLGFTIPDMDMSYRVSLYQMITYTLAGRGSLYQNGWQGFTISGDDIHLAGRVSLYKVMTYTLAGRVSLY